MKHLDSKLRQLALFVALTSFFAATAATITSFPYTETNYKSNWTYSNYNGSWSLYTDYCEAKIVKGENNSWLFSPALQIQEGYIYTFSFTLENLNSSWPNSTVEFYILNDDDKNAEQIKVLGTVVLSKNEMKKTVSLEFESSLNANVYFAAHDVSNGSDGYQTKFNNFSVSEEISARLPKAVSGLAYATSGDDGTTVSLTWTNPELDTFGDPLQIKHIRLDVNGE